MQSQSSPTPSSNIPPSVSGEALQRKHEAANPPARWILFAAALVVLMIGVCLGVGWISLKGQKNSATRNQRELPFAHPAALPATRNTTAPALEIDPQASLAEWQRREEQELQSYGWADQEAGVARIPIDRAIDLILREGLPVLSTNTAAPSRSSLQLLQERARPTRE